MLLAVYIPVLMTVAICVFARQIGKWLGVIDHPDDGRKDHAEPTPLVGGIAIMVPVVVWAAIRVASQSAKVEGLETALVLCAGGVAVIGFMDDQHMVAPSARLILLAIFSMVALLIDPGLVVFRVHTLTWGWVSISPALSTALVVLALMGFSSAVNMADGVNGLVLSLICIWTLCLAIIGGIGADAAELILVASLVTLLFNVRGRLFIGDCGAFAIAFTVGIVTIETHNQGRLPLETVVVWFLLPVVDCLRLIPLRILRGRSPFRPDKLHFHHRLALRIGERRAIATYVGVVGATSLAASLKPQVAIACICVESVLYFGFVLADAWASPATRTTAARTVSANVVALGETKRRGT